MLKKHIKVLRYNLKGGYKVVEELWRCAEEDKHPTKMISAYNANNDYIGNVKDAKYLAKRGISQFEKTSPEHSVCSIGFNKKEQKWYGWSHRAIYGFGVGSSVKKGDCAYIPATPQDMFNEVTKVEVWGDDGSTWQWQKPENVEILEKGIRVRVPMTKPVYNKEQKKEFDKIYEAGKISTFDCEIVGWEEDEPQFFEIECGRGEWIAKTLDDAKQMAIDFANGVS